MTASHRSELVDECHIISLCPSVVFSWEFANGVSEIVVKVHVLWPVVVTVFCPSRRANMTFLRMECLRTSSSRRMVRSRCRNDEIVLVKNNHNDHRDDRDSAFESLRQENLLRQFEVKKEKRYEKVEKFQKKKI